MPGPSDRPHGRILGVAVLFGGRGPPVSGWLVVPPGDRGGLGLFEVSSRMSPSLAERLAGGLAQVGAVPRGEAA